MIAAIRAKVDDPRFSISVKLNSVEFMDGFTPEDCRDICLQLQDAKVDFVELSGGTYEALGFSHKSESTQKREAYFIEFAKLITPTMNEEKTLVYLTGGFRTSRFVTKSALPKTCSVKISLLTRHRGMQTALSDGVCTGCGMGRPCMFRPFLVPFCHTRARSLMESYVVVASDPYLATKFLTDASASAPRDEVPDALSILASGINITRIAKGQVPLDLGSPEDINRIMKAVGEWLEVAARQAKLGIALPGYCQVPDAIDASGTPLRS